MAINLFYLGSTYSYVLIRYAFGLDMVWNILDLSVYVYTPIRDYLVVTQVYHAFSIMFIDI